MTALHRKIAKAAEEDPFFQVLQDPEGWPVASGKPLLIIIHPGDALEFLSDWSDREVGRGVVALSQANQAGMATEINAKLPTHDMLILHRSSSRYLQSPGANSDYRQAITRAQRTTAVLYGDDLDAAASWLINRVYVANAPKIHMTGAYADADSGCITAIGKALQVAFPAIPVTVSSSAPTDNSNHSPRWVPLAPATKAPRP